MSIQIKIKQFIRQQQLIKKGDLVIIGISAGADSVALTFLLHEIKYELGFRIHLAYFHHHLAKQDDLDQILVKKISAHLSSPLTIGNWHHKSGKFFNEEQARQARLIFFEEVMNKQKANSLALAHHQDDLAETVLMRILRGSGTLGMRSILPKRNFNFGIIIRPLLTFTKKEIVQYLKTNRISFNVDPSNFDTKILRNKIRHKLIPLLQKEYNPSIQNVLSNLATITAEDANFIEAEARAKFKKIAKIKATSITFPAASFMKLPRAVQFMLLRFAYEALNGDILALSMAHLSEVMDLIQNRSTASIVDWPKGCWVQKQKTAILIQRG